MKQHHNSHNQQNNNLHLKNRERRTCWVLLICLATMFLEIIFGYITNSMALLSDGWHMTTHVIALGAAWITYKYVLNQQEKKKEVNTAKILALVGLINASALVLVAIFVFVESIERFCEPITIKFSEAIYVTVIGLLVNIASAKLLHLDDGHSDHNYRATYLHIVADILTSLLALLALLTGLFFHFYAADAIVGIIGSLVIINWCKSIIINAQKEIFGKKQKERK